MKKAFPAALGALVLLVASACGSSGPDLTKTEAKISKAIATALAKPDDSLLSKKGAKCVADRFVSDVGEKKLKSVKAVGADNTYNTNGANVDKKTSAAYSKALLECVKEKPTLKAYEKAVVKTVSATANSGLSKDDIGCFADKFVNSAGVKRLLSSQVITDTGVLNTAATASPDKETATNYADALLDCVNYRSLLAKQAASTDKKIDTAKLEACFKRDISDDEIRDLLVANQTQSAETTALGAALTKKSDACAKESKK